MSLGARGGELLRVVARDRYVNGHNGEFLCIKGRFAHPFIKHDGRIKTPRIRYRTGGKLVPATWDEAIRHTAAELADTGEDQHVRVGEDALHLRVIDPTTEPHALQTLG